MSYSEFWPFYVSQHLNPINRRLHFVGTSGVMVLLLAALTLSWKFLLLTPLAGYGFAWVGHFFFERNKPATFQYPVWSLIGDFHMYTLMWRRKMGELVERIHVETAIPTADCPESLGSPANPTSLKRT
jgi:hypothetical protein